MPRCRKEGRATPRQLPEEAEVCADLVNFWNKLPLAERKRLLTVDRKALFARIRTLYCSRCYGLFVLRYEEMKGMGAGAVDCPACQEFYAGLVVSEAGELALEEAILNSQPFSTFSEAKLREREREMQFMTGDICGSGFQKRPGLTMCALHTSPVPYEALTDYYHELPAQHRAALLTLREEDFAAELDAHLKYQLRICRDCRGNVMRAYKDLKPSSKGQVSEQPSLELCNGFTLRVAEKLVAVDGEDVTEFFNRAEDVEGCKALDLEDDDYDNPDKIRHAETPELAREALVDSAVLIYKSQIEVAFREQTAGHNALLLFVGLALELMEQQLLNAFKELGAKEAEAELLNLVAKEKERKEGKLKKKGKKGKATEVSREEQEVAHSEGHQCSSSSGASVEQMSSPQRTLPASPPRHGHQPGLSPPRRARAVPMKQEEPREADVGGWEVQHGKRRGAAPGGKKAVGSGGSSESTTPERVRRGSIEIVRSKSPVPVRRAMPISGTVATSGPKKPAATRVLAVPIHLQGCTCRTCMGSLAPPPPPPPRETRKGTPVATPAPWAGVQAAAIAAQSAQEWNPWSGRSPNLAVQWGPPGGSPAPARQHLASKIAVIGPVGRMQAQGSAGPSLGSLAEVDRDRFSLFHNSPVPKSKVLAGKHERMASVLDTPRGYELFGAPQGSYPLAPLTPVVSL